MRHALLIAALIALSTPALAQTADARLNRDWIGLGTAQEHLAESLAAYIKDVNTRTADLESRLKWVLDNWLKPATPPAGKK